MKQFTKIFYLLFAIIIYSTCKKRPDGIYINVIDPLLNQVISGAKVAIIEQKLSGGFLSGGYECKVIASKETDQNGNVCFEKVKFKNNSSINYFAVVLEAYGKELFWSCGNHKTDDFLKKTNKKIEKTVYAYAEKIDWQVKINKLNSGGFGTNLSDSLSVKIYRDFDYFDDFIDDLNGSKNAVDQIILNKSIYTILNNPESYSCCEYNYLTKIFPGKYKIVLYKKQNNVVSQISYTENVVPNVNNYVFNIDW